MRQHRNFAVMPDPHLSFGRLGLGLFVASVFLLNLPVRSSKLLQVSTGTTSLLSSNEAIAASPPPDTGSPSRTQGSGTRFTEC